MVVFFEKTVSPCVDNEVTRWHTEHGWVWNVYDVRNGVFAGVFFASLLCGDGCVCHFIRKKSVPVSPSLILAAFKKGMRIISPVCDVIYATVPERKEKLIQVLIKLGFGLTGSVFYRNGDKIILLQYFPAGKSNLK